jgi:nitrate reductase NapD
MARTPTLSAVGKSMNVSGILVVVPVADVVASVESLAALPGVDVHHVDEETGRIIVTQEGETVHEEVERLKTIKALPGVILAEMVHHHFEDDRERLDSIPTELEDESLGVVPSMLRD